MNASAFLITLIVYLPMQAQSASLVAKRDRPLVNDVKTVISKKPPCGPVIFPDISCEEVNTVTTKDDVEIKSIEEEPLHGRYKTTNVMIDMMRSALRDGPWYNFKEAPRHYAESAFFARQQFMTTSTMAPFEKDADPNDPNFIHPSTVDTKCQNNANCHTWDWTETV